MTYHRYGDDDGAAGRRRGRRASRFTTADGHDHGTTVKGSAFTGEVLNDEFGPSYKPDISRDNEVAASYIAKIVHLLGSDTTTAPPSSYGYWAMSDLYEENDTGTATAYRPGNFGLLLKGDPLDPRVVRRRQAGLQRVSPAAHDGRPAARRHRRDDRQRRERGGHAQHRRHARSRSWSTTTPTAARPTPPSRHVVSLTVEQPAVHRPDPRAPVHRRLHPRQLVPGLAGDGLADEADPGRSG